ncbi:MAG: class I SAM-dependent methyltransferase [Polyangiaceae bacterium]|nr:class I SAM-dependent methyltransferase [Polyangiaceae bacterium]
MPSSEPGARSPSSYLRVAGVGFPLCLTALAVLGVRAVTPPPTGGEVMPRSGQASATSHPPPSTSKAFEDVYRQATWGTNSRGVGNSGSGSTVAATAVYRAYLQGFLKQHGVRSVVDAGCGDWEFSSTIDWSGIDYKGYDIVAEVIEKNREKYKLPNVSFFVGNVAEIELPPADLIISKHVLQHLSNRDVSAILRQLPKYEHALLVNGVGDATLSSTNPDIVAGEYRPLDPTRPPFDVVGRKELTYWDDMHMHQVVHVRR